MLDVQQLRKGYAFHHRPRCTEGYGACFGGISSGSVPVCVWKTVVFVKDENVVERYLCLSNVPLLSWWDLFERAAFRHQCPKCFGTPFQSATIPSEKAYPSTCVFVLWRQESRRLSTTYRRGQRDRRELANPMGNVSSENCVVVWWKLIINKGSQKANTQTILENLLYHHE